ncbi:PREDICTED: long-chain-fatty-acid--CoA ligase 1-like [Priapulus caudatus]|uniref:Long-chain-fatty-acid--CoA ligase n=1 Tax=Priapulus caudatus TaxID=37621 RepID=A0ABM1DTE0_PRICU|nr:PREDICTED: long-chain-fatty-acid--CoA ligase 1-like [Priapulus caudatus]XP_014663202.1 PREDICTED: long-chain-fatty-acid--CoA ligase 1-like [Priapulus caudatus]XP_014663211.1 PREDICTED: long-chain-fatty-acid--CoA ligase 1-like [Priapulus caudatus]
MDLEKYASYIGGTAGLVGIGAATAASALYLATRPSPIVPLIDLNRQSLEMSDGSNISRFCSRDGKLIRYLFDDGKTLHECFKRGERVSQNGPAYGYRAEKDSPYKWLSYSEILTHATNLGSGLIQKGLAPRPATFIGLYSQNRIEWVVTEQACYMYSMVIVPLYDTLGPDACSFIIDQAEIGTVICDTEQKAERLIRDAKQTRSLQRIVLMCTVLPALAEKAKRAQVELLSFTELQQIGREKQHSPVPCKPQDLATVCYTSGTTGTPKGVMLTHENVVSCSAACLLHLGSLITECREVMISYLPLAHMLERIVQCCVYSIGGCIGFYRGDIKCLLDDVKELRPTIFPVVPRLLNRIYDKVLQGVRGSRFKSMLFHLALRAKLAEMKRGIIRNNSIWDKLVFSKVQAMMGGRVSFMVTGSAPVADNVLSFIRCAVGCAVLEGYGQTECVAPCTLTTYGDNTPGHVGPPLPCNQIKLVDVQEMEYFAHEGKGEVCIRGPNVFIGYFRDPRKTAEALDEQGWLHTGDIGEWMPNGTLRIVDRKKHIFKLAQGEYVAAEKIENVYHRCPLVAQIYVHGDSLKSCLVGIVVPDPDVLPRFSTQNGIEGENMHDWCQNKDIKKIIFNDLISAGKEAALCSFEQVKEIYLHPELFSVENNLLTPTFKSKRPALAQFFRPQIDTMYSNLE